MCRVLRLHQSGYYRWLKSHEGRNREGRNRVLGVQIKALFGEFKGRYGCPRLCRELRLPAFVPGVA